MKLSCSNIKRFLIFNQKKGFFISQEMKTAKRNFLKFQETSGNSRKFQEVTFPA